MEVMQRSSYHSSAIDSSLDEVGFYGFDIDTGRGNCDFFSPPHISTEEYCFRNLEEKIAAFDEVEGFFNWTGGENGSPSEDFSDSSAQKQISLVLPNEELELDNQTSILHLLKACGEAIENRKRELVEVILRRLQYKGCPKGAAAERLAYHLTRYSDEFRSDGYLAQEASKNYKAAFRAIYQIFPYERFAHFVANSLILEGVPEDAEVIRIVDFDMGGGVQWPPLIEALGKKHRKAIQIQLVSIKFEDCDVPTKVKKRRLCECAASSGLKLEVEEMGMEILLSEVKRMEEEERRREWLVFNCTVGLPHMGKQRSSRHVCEFLKAAQETINNPGNGYRKRGIIMFGDGIGLGGNSDSCGFGFFFEAQMGRLTALLESMECQMPSHLREARTAMECLFVAPFVSSSLACLEERGWRGGILPKMELDGLRMSECTVAEAKELVREGESLHWVKTEEENENQAVLCFCGDSTSASFGLELISKLSTQANYLRILLFFAFYFFGGWRERERLDIHISCSID